MAREPAPPSYSSIHNNDNLLCAVDVGTTGLEPSRNELIELAIIPLGPDYRPTRQFRFFHIRVRADGLDGLRDDELRGKRQYFTDCCLHGIERWTGVQRLEEWFESLRLPPGKKVVPLGSNYSFDRDFLIEFMGGVLSYRYIFRDDYRDTMLAAVHHNDLADWHNERIPFPKYSLTYLCRILGVENPVKHRAIPDALATAEVYRRLMRYKDLFAITPQMKKECDHQFDAKGTCTRCLMIRPDYIQAIEGYLQIPKDTAPAIEESDDVHSSCTPANQP